MKTRVSICIILVATALTCAAWIASHHGRDTAPPPQRPAQITADGTLLLRGKPFFPIGIYQVNHTDAEYALLAANGFNSVQGDFTLDAGRFLQTLDLAQRHHLAVAVPLHAENLVKVNLDKSLAKIRAAAEHPAVLSWKICDEPDSEMHRRLRSEVPPAYHAIKNLNPGQPVQLTLSKDATLGKWTRYCELVEIDRYPVPGKPLTQVLDFCIRTRKAMEPWQNLTFVVQCGWTRDLKTQPTFDEARAMVYLAIIGGAKGIFWYSRQEKDGWDLTATPLWPRLKEINAEIDSLSAPVMLGLDVPGILCSARGVHFIGRRHLEKLYLLATNPGDASADAIFTLPAAIHARSARVAENGQPLAMNGQSVRLPLGGTDSATIVFDL